MLGSPRSSLCSPSFVLGVAIKIPIVCVVLEGGPGTLNVSPTGGWASGSSSVVGESNCPECCDLPPREAVGKRG